MLKPGDIISAKIVRVEDYGLFLECGDQTIFVNLPEVSWKPLRGGCKGYFHPGEEIKVQLYGWSEARGYFFGSAKALHPEENPWRDPFLYQEGTVYPGKVCSVADYGYFLTLPPGADGLLLLEHTRRKLQVGDILDVVIKSVDAEKQRIFLKLLSDS